MQEKCGPPDGGRRMWMPRRTDLLHLGSAQLQVRPVREGTAAGQ